MAVIKVSLAWAWPASSGETSLNVDTGVTIGEVLIQAALQGSIMLPPAVVRDATSYGVWGRPRPKSYVVRDGDRIEIYRQLTADPKEARRHRVQKSRNHKAVKQPD